MKKLSLYLVFSVVVLLCACSTHQPETNIEVIKIYTTEIDSHGNEYQALMRTDTIFLDDSIPKL